MDPRAQVRRAPDPVAEDAYFKEVRSISEEEWTVKRTAVLEEVVEYNNSVKWRVRVSDEGRLPFLTRFFGSPVAAQGFIEKLKNGG